MESVKATFIQTLHGFAGLLFGLWMSIAVYISARLVFSKPTRDTILPRLVFLRERDEREVFLTGNATKINFLVTLAILILLLCLNAFRVSFYQVPPDQAPSDKNKVVTLSVDFSLIDQVKETAVHGSKSFFNYSGLPISKTAILLFLIIWQIASYNYLMKQLTKKERVAMQKRIENVVLVNRRNHFQVIFAIIALSVSSQAFSKVTVKYTVTPNVHQMFALVKVNVDGLDSESTPEIEVSEQFGSANGFYRDVNGLKVTAPAGITLVNSAPNKWRVSSKLEGGVLEYEYQIKIHQNFPNEKVRFKPSLNSKSYYSNGYPLFVFPSRYLEQAQGIQVEKFVVDFKLPTGWRSVTSLNKSGGGWTTNKIDALLASTLALGDYRYISHRLPNGTPFKMILNGKWLFSDEALAKAAYKIVSAQINMMGAWHFPLYSVVLSQSPERGASGSGLENAFEMFGDSQRTLDDFYYLISHENFHYWNGNRIRYGEPRTRWFSEGFTEYYTYITVGRMKLGSIQANLDTMSKTIQAYSENPVAEKITFERAGKHFWEWLPEYGHLFYSKGMLIAMMVDVHLRSSSNNSLSLDGFMRFLDRKYFASGKTVDDNALAMDLEKYSGFDWQDFFDQFIFGSNQLPTNDYIRSGGMEVIDVNCKRPDLGFTMMPYSCADGTPCGYQALDVIKDGPAYHSGISEGDVITRWEPSFVQKMPPHTPVKFGVKGPDGNIVWHEYISGEKNTQCKQLAFVEDPDSMAKQIRDSIWQMGKSNLSNRLGALFQP